MIILDEIVGEYSDVIKVPLYSMFLRKIIMNLSTSKNLVHWYTLRKDAFNYQISYKK